MESIQMCRTKGKGVLRTTEISNLGLSLRFLFRLRRVVTRGALVLKWSLIGYGRKIKTFTHLESRESGVFLRCGSQAILQFPELVLSHIARNHSRETISCFTRVSKPPHSARQWLAKQNERHKQHGCARLVPSEERDRTGCDPALRRLPLVATDL